MIQMYMKWIPLKSTNIGMAHNKNSTFPLMPMYSCMRMYPNPSNCKNLNYLINSL